VSVRLGDNSLIKILGHGNVCGHVNVNGNPPKVVLHNVVLALALVKNLLLPSRLTGSGYTMLLNSSGCRVLHLATSTTLFTAYHHHGILIVLMHIQQHNSALAAMATLSLCVAHC